MQSRNVIKTPDVKPRCVGDLKKDKIKRPLVKYIFVTKVSEYHKKFRIRGIPMVSRFYGIGILTSTNQYYYSEFHSKQTVLTGYNVNLFRRIFLSKYLYDSNTRILLEDTIDKNKEPISQFLGIISSIYALQIRTANFKKMVLRINGRYDYVKAKYTKKNKITEYHCNMILASLFDHHSFGFITDSGWYERTRYKSIYNIAQIHCAIGILFCHIMFLNNKYNRNSKKMKERMRLEEIARKELEKEENERRKRII